MTTATQTSHQPVGATIWGAPEGQDALLLARRRAEWAGAMLHVSRDDQRLARLAEAIGFFAPEIELLRFPAWDCLPYDRASPNPEIVSERIATLTRLLEPARAPCIVLTTVNALVQRVPPRAAFVGASLALRVNAQADPSVIARFLEANGYGRADTVMEPGEYAMRGGIMDIFPAGEPEPLRLDFFGDTLESLRRFDPTTQRSAPAANGKRSGPDGLTLRPVAEFSLDAEHVARFRTAWRALFGQAAAADPLYEAVSQGRRAPGLEHWAPLFHHGMATLLDYLPAASVSLDHQADEVLANRLELIADHHQARQAAPRDGEVAYRPLPPERLYLDRAGWMAMLGGGPVIQFVPYAKPDGADGLDAGGRPGPIFTQAAGAAPVFEQLNQQADTWMGRGQRVAVAAWTAGSRERIAHLLREHGLRAAPAASWTQARAMPPKHHRPGDAGDRTRLHRSGPGGGVRAGSAGRAHQPSAAPAQARGSVHRRSHRNRRRRSGGARGSRHRPL